MIFTLRLLCFKHPYPADQLGISLLNGGPVLRLCGPSFSCTINLIWLCQMHNHIRPIRRLSSPTYERLASIASYQHTSLKPMTLSLEPFTHYGNTIEFQFPSHMGFPTKFMFKYLEHNKRTGLKRCIKWQRVLDLNQWKPYYVLRLLSKELL